MLQGLGSRFAAPPEVYLLALVPAVLWGLTPVVEKRGMDGGGTALQASLVVVVVDTTLYGLALLATEPDPFAGLAVADLLVFGVAGVVGTSLGRIAVFVGVKRVGAAVNSAAVSTRPLFATALAVGFLGEGVTLTTGVGVVVLVAGLLVLSTARGGDLSGWEPRDILFPVGAAAFFAVGNVLRRYGLQATTASTLEAVAVNEVAALLGLLAFVLATRGSTARSSRGLPSVGFALRGPEAFRAPRETYAYFAASGTMTAVALLALFAAFAHPEGRVAIVDPLAATAPLFTVVFAAVLLRDVERVSRGVVAGSALIVVGVALVVVSTAGGAPA